MKLLPNFFKQIGIVLFILGMIMGIDDFLAGLSGNETLLEHRIMPLIFYRLSDYLSLLGMLLYILAKNKREDEFAQKMRFEAAFIVLIISIIFILLLYITIPELKLEPSTLIGAQMAIYLIIRSVRRTIILGN